MNVSTILFLNQGLVNRKKCSLLSYLHALLSYFDFLQFHTRQVAYSQLEIVMCCEWLPDVYAVCSTIVLVLLVQITWITKSVR